MKTHSKGLAVLTLLTFACGIGHSAGETVKSPDITLALEPARYVFVEGDASKFRAHHWMSTEYATGIKEFGFEDELSNDVSLFAEGHAIPNDGDYAAEVKLTKEGFGYLLFDYKQFRKYYASGGGVYGAFTTLPHANTDKELALNIGEFSLEAGLRTENLPDLTLNYTREFKNGTKSRLTWTGITEGPTASGGSPDVMRKIGPSWQEITEVVDQFSVKAEDETWYGIHWHGEQEWEYVRSKNMREEATLSNTPNPASGSNSDQKIRDQFTEPRSNLITTILGLNKWFSKDRVYASSDYRFAQLSSRELENIYEYDQNRVPTIFSNAEQVVDAHSDNLYTSNTWVSSLSSFLWESFSIATRFKVESIGRRGESTYPKDKALGNNNGTIKPDGAVDEISVSDNTEKIANFGEGISLRFTGIPRVALYNEYEFQQTRSNLYEDRRSGNSSEVFNRQDISHLHRGSGVLGASYSPWNMVHITADARHREDDINYNHARYTNNSTSGAKSVFVDGQYIETNEFSSKIRLKPWKWLQPSFRYQFDNTTYDTWGLSDSDNEQESGLKSHTYTWDVVIQPMDDLMTTSSLSVQNATMFTPASLNATAAHTPTANMNVLSALFCAEYALNKDTILIGITQWSDAGNFNNQGGPISYGADYTELDVSFGVQWTPKKDMTIKPKYAYYRYDPSPDAEFGGYNASVVSIDVQFKWG